MTSRRPSGALAALAGLSDRGTTSWSCSSAPTAVTWLSLRNAPEVHIVAVDQLNTYDVLACDDVVFTKARLRRLRRSRRTADSTATPATDVEKEADK